ALLEGDRHRGLATGERPAVRPIQAPRAAPLTASDLGMVAPQLGRGPVVKGDTAVGVSGVDRDRQRLEQLSPCNHRGFLHEFWPTTLRPPNECCALNPPHKQGELNARAASAQARPASPIAHPTKTWPRR